MYVYARPRCMCMPGGVCVCPEVYVYARKQVRKAGARLTAEGRQLLLRDLRMNPYAEQLLEPVSGVPEYEAVVRSPMDLGTVGRKLECGAYLSADGFARDVGLVLQNAIVFNSWRYAAAQFWRNSAQFAHRPSITSTARTSASTPR